MDVEVVHDIAPDAHVVYVAAASCDEPDVNDALARIVDNKLASIVTILDLDAAATRQIVNATDRDDTQTVPRADGWFLRTATGYLPNADVDTNDGDSGDVTEPCRRRRHRPGHRWLPNVSRPMPYRKPSPCRTG